MDAHSAWTGNNIILSVNSYAYVSVYAPVSPVSLAAATMAVLRCVWLWVITATSSSIGYFIILHAIAPLLFSLSSDVTVSWSAEREILSLSCCRLFVLVRSGQSP